LPQSTTRIPVHAPLETLWAVLRDKMLHPDGYIQRAHGPEILETFPDGVRRRMHFRGLVLEERITVDPQSREIAFVLLDHPVYRGSVINRIVRQGGELYLEMVRSWTPLDPGVDPLDHQEMVRSLERTARNIRDRAEREAVRVA